MSACLLAIDLIDDFLRPLPSADADRIVSQTNDLVAFFRATNRPIIWVRQEFAPDLSDAFLEMRDRDIHTAITGTPGAALDHRLHWRESDLTIIKKRYSAFFGTNLDDVLHDLDVSELVIAGVNTHACVRMAAIDAYQRDLRVILATECLGSPDQQHARISIGYLDGKIALALTNHEIRNRLAD